MHAPTLYTFDHRGAFAGTVEARLSPGDLALGEEVWLIPEGATDHAPPEAADGEVAVWRDGAWSVVPDHRGQIAYDTTSREAATIEAPGPLPENLTTEPPPSPLHAWNGEAWALPLAAAKLLRLQEVGVALATAMAAGFAHGGKVYQIDEASQNRIASLALKAERVVDQKAGATWDDDFAFIAADNTPTRFTAAQFGPFADAASNVVIARRMRARALKDQVLAAQTTHELEAIDIDGASWD